MKSFFTVIKLRLKSLFRSGSNESEMDREMQFHLESAIEQNIENGMSPREARQNAAREFGSVERYKEDCRDSWGVRLLQDLFQDIRYGIRQLSKARGFAAIAILTIAIGIGSVTALFSIVNTVLLQPLPYENADRIVRISETFAQETPSYRLSVGFYFDVLEQSTVFESLSATSWESGSITHDSENIRIYVNKTTPSSFDVFSRRMILGRSFRADEAVSGSNPVAILSKNLWLTRFGGATDILGQQIQVDEQSHTVIGVLDNESTTNYVMAPTNHSASRSNYETANVVISGMLKPGSTLEQARSELSLIASRIAREHPATHKGHGVNISTILEVSANGAEKQLLTLLSGVGFLLLIACVNVTSLLLARASARQKELSIRGALGASRGRIIRQLLCESMLISFIGGTLGVFIAYSLLKPLATFASHFMGGTGNGIPMDGTVLLVACGLMLLAGLGIGLIPALQTTRSNVGNALKDMGRGSTGNGQQINARNTLVIIEIALALMLLTGTGLLVRSLRAMQNFDQGVKTLNVQGTRLELTPASRYDSPEKMLNFTRNILERIEALPDVAAVSVSNSIPMGNRNRVRNRSFSLDGDTSIPAEEMLLANYYTITPGYFDVMSIPLIRGRTITPQDIPGGPPVVVVNREMAERHFPNQNPIGQHIMIISDSNEPNLWHEIVGVVGNVKPQGPQSLTEPQFYTPFTQNPQADLSVMIRSKGSAPSLSKTVAAILNKAEPSIAATRTYPFEAAISYSWIREKFSMILFSIFSGLALLLAVIGIYGVMAYTVSQRTNEIGIRMALGALPRDVLRLMLKSGTRIIILGVLLGATGSLACVRLLESFLFNTSPYDPVTFISISIILTTVALVACYLPARRATKIDPMIAMGSD